MSLPDPILAAGFEGLVAIAFLVISVIGWVINQAGGQNNPGPKPGAAPRPQPKRQQVQNEIDSFLQQATGKRPARGNAGMIADEDIEVVEEGPARRPVAPERRPPARPQPLPQAQPAKPMRPEPARPQPQPVRAPAPAVSPRPTPTTLGMGVRQHVATHMVDQISQHVAQDVPRAIEAQVQRRMGMTSESQPAAPPSSLAASVAAELRDAQAFRKAVILNEILSPPLSRRNRQG